MNTTPHYILLDGEVIETHSNFTDARQKANYLAEGRLGELAVVADGKVVYTPKELGL